MNPISITDIADIDLDKDAFIEASAGSGKTYTIENLVVRYLMENPEAPMESVLLVTFTEKATAELKTRIREKLESKLQQNDPKSAARMKQLLNEFDSASVFTIHGFCSGLLTDFAFENGVLFETEVVDPEAPAGALLKEQMRTAWPSDPLIPGLIAHSTYAENKNRFFSTVSALLNKRHDRLIPDIADINPKTAENEVIRAAARIGRLMSPVEDFVEGYVRLNFNKNAQDKILRELVYPMAEFFAAFDPETAVPGSVISLCRKLTGVSSAGRKGVDVLVPEKWNKGGANLSVCPNLVEIRDQLHQLAALAEVLVHYPTIIAARRLQADFKREMRSRGKITYDDMLSLVAESLDGPGKWPLIKAVREKYHIAFVDEFQDTDPVQWRIFREFFLDSPDRRLVLVGDPKQAIYGFRGADVHTYLEARALLTRRAAEGKAGMYTLTRNWRSHPRLISVFNRIFRRKEWFPPADEADEFTIGCTEALPPPESAKPVPEHPKNEPVLIAVDLAEYQTTSEKHRAYAKFIAGEIRRLTTGGAFCIAGDGDAVRPLDFGDICVLVNRRREAVYIEEQLAECRPPVPFTCQDRKGLFETDEAFYLSRLLRSIHRPEDPAAVHAALLTPFFDLPPETALAYRHLDAAHPLRRLFTQWQLLAGRRGFGVLFQSIMESTGFLYRVCRDSRRERILSNYRRIFEILLRAADRHRFGFPGLVSHLEGLLTRRVEGEADFDKIPVETDARKVHILTIHAGKGLEFPVVFIAGGYTKGPYPDFFEYVEVKKKNGLPRTVRVIDLTRRNTEKHEEVRKSEDKRLYYVALTRARQRVYLPLTPKKRHINGPMPTLTGPAFTAAFPRDTPDVIRREAVENDGPETIGVITQKGPPAPPEPVSGGVLSPPFPETTAVFHRRIRRESFTSLTKGSSAPVSMEIPEDPAHLREDDELDGALFIESPAVAENESALPGGAEVGSMLHRVLEKITFREAYARGRTDFPSEGLRGDPKVRAEILDALVAYRIDSGCAETVYEMVINALRTPLPQVEPAFCLGNLPAGDMIREMEFTFPVTIQSDGRRRTDVLRGAIDLVFRHGGKYYLADWKSNFLSGGYKPDSLSVCMDAADYHLQYRIYTAAFFRRFCRC